MDMKSPRWKLRHRNSEIVKVICEIMYSEKLDSKMSSEILVLQEICKIGNWFSYLAITLAISQIAFISISFLILHSRIFLYIISLISSLLH